MVEVEWVEKALLYPLREALITHDGPARKRWSQER